MFFLLLVACRYVLTAMLEYNGKCVHDQSDQLHRSNDYCIACIIQASGENQGREIIECPEYKGRVFVGKRGQVDGCTNVFPLKQTTKVIQSYGTQRNLFRRSFTILGEQASVDCHFGFPLVFLSCADLRLVTASQMDVALSVCHQVAFAESIIACNNYGVNYLVFELLPSRSMQRTSAKIGRDAFKIWPFGQLGLQIPNEAQAARLQSQVATGSKNRLNYNE